VSSFKDRLALANYHYYLAYTADLRCCRCQLHYLPPYSPDYNPIEEGFSTVKKWMQKHHGRWLEGQRRATENGDEPPEFGDFILETLDAFIDRPLDHFHSCNIIFEE